MLPRTAPPASATATPQTPNPSGCSCIDLCLPGSGPWEFEPPVYGIAQKNEQKQDALQDRDGGVRQIVRALQHAATGEKTSQEQRHDNNADRILARQKGHQNTGVSR